MEKCIIVAIADNRAIGKANALLWHIAEDMKYFRQTTTGCPVIMGWMTFQSIGGKPLPKRDNVVISICSFYNGKNIKQPFNLIERLQIFYVW